MGDNNKKWKKPKEQKFPMFSLIIIIVSDTTTTTEQK
jgi:hypothetical protein